MIPKFRAWDKTINYMDYRVRFSHFEDGIEVLDSWSSWRELKKDEYELMQYTGLKDKNGVEIYEGDIVKRIYLDGMFGRTHIGEVVYDKEYARYVIRKPQKYTEPKTEDIRNTLSDRITYEVIGNIHNNPELLED